MYTILQVCIQKTVLGLVLLLLTIRMCTPPTDCHRRTSASRYRQTLARYQTLHVRHCPEQTNERIKRGKQTNAHAHTHARTHARKERTNESFVAVAVVAVAVVVVAVAVAVVAVAVVAVAVVAAAAAAAGKTNHRTTTLQTLYTP